MRAYLVKNLYIKREVPLTDLGVTSYRELGTGVREGVVYDNDFNIVIPNLVYSAYFYKNNEYIIVSHDIDSRTLIGNTLLGLYTTEKNSTYIVFKDGRVVDISSVSHYNLITRLFGKAKIIIGPNEEFVIYYSNTDNTKRVIKYYDISDGTNCKKDIMVSDLFFEEIKDKTKKYINFSRVGEVNIKNYIRANKDIIDNTENCFPVITMSNLNYYTYDDIVDMENGVWR